MKILSLSIGTLGELRALTAELPPETPLSFGGAGNCSANLQIGATGERVLTLDEEGYEPDEHL